MKYIYLILIIFVQYNIFAQCYPDRHNTTWFEGWESCEKSQNPNPARPKSHWIMYDFGYQYKLGNLHLWNVNDPENLSEGVKKISIDYSTNGSNWNQFGQVDVAKATGKSIYEGLDIADLGGVTARYLLITCDENWGGACYGFSELRLNIVASSSLELVYFDIDCDENQSSTNISANFSLNNDLKTLSLQKSLDSFNWIEVDTKEVNRNSSGKVTFSDDEPGSFYYRIVSKDASGNKYISNSKFCTRGYVLVTAYPNPFYNDVRIDVMSTSTGDITYELTDLLGRLIDKGKIKNAAITNIDLRLSSLEPGNYYFKATQGNKSKNIKLIKM